MVQGLTQLTDVDLSYNEIEYVGPNVFCDSPKINRIILSYNPVKWVDPTALQSALISMNQFDFDQNINYRKACWMDAPIYDGSQSYNATIACNTFNKVVVNCRPDGDFDRYVSMEILLRKAKAWDEQTSVLSYQMYTVVMSITKCGCTYP